MRRALADRIPKGLRTRAARALASPWLPAGLFALVSALVRWPFVEGRVSPLLQNDTRAYFAAAELIGDGQLFANQPVPRAHGYMTFIAAADLLPGDMEHNVVLVQHVLGVVLVTGAVLVAWRLFGPATAWLTGLVIATSPLLFAIEDEALPDFLFGALVFASAAVLALVASRDRDTPPGLRWAVMAGALIGMATLVKQPALPLLAAPALVAVLLRRPRREALRFGAAGAVAGLLVLAPWMLHSLVRYGTPALSQQGGITLFYRVFELDRRPVPADTVWGPRLAAVIAAEEGEPLETRTRPYLAAYLFLQEQGLLSPRDAAGVMRSLAVKAIGREPLDYTADTVTGTRRFLSEVVAPAHVGDPLLPRAGEGAGIAPSVWSLGARVSDAWWIAGLHGIAGLLALFVGSPARRRAAAVLVGVWAVVALTTVAGHGGLPRYSVQLAPITWLVTIAGVTAVASAVRRGRRPLA